MHLRRAGFVPRRSRTATNVHRSANQKGVGRMTSTQSIHLVWLGSSVPARVDSLAARLREVHPDADVRVWTDADLTWLSNHEELLAEPRMSGKANIARYEILLRHGGVYLDADFKVHQPLDEVFSAVERFGLVVTRQSSVVFNPAFIAARAGHPAMERAVSGIIGSRRRFRDAGSPVRTGPHYFTSVLLDHLRAGGTFGELPQHAIYPWYIDEDPLVGAAVPRSVIASHEWATMHGSTYWTSDDSAATPASTAKRTRGGGSLRARVASSPLAHEAIRRVEGIGHRGGLSARILSGSPDRNGAVGRTADEGLIPTRTDAALEAWTSRLIVGTLRGSDTFLDIAPGTYGAFLTALQVLDRPGRALISVRGDARPPESWRDRSIRCSAHVLSLNADDADRVVEVESEGSALLTREVSSEHGLLGFRTTDLDATLSGLVDAIPRFALVRCVAEAMSPQLRETLSGMLLSSRIRQLLIVIDPLSVSQGVSSAVDLVRQQSELSRSVTLAPWLVDGRGREWDEHLRIAARPFIVSVQ